MIMRVQPKIDSERVVDEQLVDVAITTREVENLMEYDESLDVLSTSNAFGDCVGMDDDLLKGLLEANGQWLMEVDIAKHGEKQSFSY
jgi:hypothetical protein